LNGGYGFQPGAGKSGRLRRGGDKNSAALRPDAKVMFAAERAVAGMAVVKQRIEEIAALLLVDRARRRFGLTAPRPNLHMCFTGAPGTGKTTVALRMAQLPHRRHALGTGRSAVN
jgi:SpoVK/Ycf46/Vps4 family AAA+-type ATPase